jgi:hypothetical protein
MFYLSQTFKQVLIGKKWSERIIFKKFSNGKKFAPKDGKKGGRYIVAKLNGTKIENLSITPSKTGLVVDWTLPAEKKKFNNKQSVLSNDSNKIQ